MVIADFVVGNSSRTVHSIVRVYFEMRKIAHYCAFTDASPQKVLLFVSVRLPVTWPSAVPLEHDWIARAWTDRAQCASPPTARCGHVSCEMVLASTLRLSCRYCHDMLTLVTEIDRTDVPCALAVAFSVGKSVFACHLHDLALLATAWMLIVL